MFKLEIQNALLQIKFLTFFLIFDSYYFKKMGFLVKKFFEKKSLSI